MLPGCQLAGGTLQCVPGLTADPLQQIRILRQEISADQEQETVINKGLIRLNQLKLQGQALEGAILSASMEDKLIFSDKSAAFHWYRLGAGDDQWTLIPTANIPEYNIGAEDVGYQLMLVVVVSQPNTVERIASSPTTAIQAK